ncbi:MAG TPA: SsrA-binding protein, partial [Thermaerobacter sp.]
LAGRVRQRGYTLVPLKLYLKRGWAKVELGIVRGKKLYDKRATIARREAERRMAQVLKARAR